MVVPFPPCCSLLQQTFERGAGALVVVVPEMIVVVVPIVMVVVTVLSFGMVVSP